MLSPRGPIRIRRRGLVLSQTGRRALAVVLGGAVLGSAGLGGASAAWAGGQPSSGGVAGDGAAIAYDFGFLTSTVRGANGAGAPAIAYDFGFLAGPARSSAAAVPPPRDGGGQTLRYDFGFVTNPHGKGAEGITGGGIAGRARPAAQPDGTSGPEPLPPISAPAAAFTGVVSQRSLLVGGVDFGTGASGIEGDRLYLASNLAAIAGLECGEERQAGDVSLCAVSTRKFWTEGNRLFVQPPIVVDAEAPGLRPAPELPPARLGFVNYDFSTSINPDGSSALFGSLHPALRLRENAIDADVTIYQRLLGSGRSTQSGTKVDLSGLSYRREWFEQRLRAVAGRTQSPGHGLGGGEAFDGISLTRFNSDELGSVPTSGARPITGFAAGPGVLQYRVGDKVYKQIPIREGKYSIDSAFLSEVPHGGRLEFVGLDGQAREVAIPSLLTSNFSIYRPGDYSFDVQLGRLNGAGGGRPYASFGGIYGLSHDIGVELGLGSTDRGISLSGALNLRLPGDFGSLRGAGATSRKWNGSGRNGASIEVDYNNRFGPFSLDFSHRRNFRGGYIGLGQEQIAATGSQTGQTSQLIDNTRGSVGVSIPFPGDDISVRVQGERARYAGAKDDSRALQVDIGRNFGRLGSGFLLGRTGHDQTGQGYTSIMANWTVPLGGRLGASANYSTTRGQNSSSGDRYGATLWGSTAGGYGLGSDYQISLDQDLRIAANGNWRGRLGSISGSLTRERGERPYGTLGLRGAAVLAGGDLAFTRSISNSLLVLKAKELGGANIYVPPDLEGRSRFDGAGNGVLSDLPPYREFNLAFDQSTLPLGMEISKTGLSGSVRPYRGYIVPIPVRQLRPVRAYPAIPADAFSRGNAILGDTFAPIEVDGSIYFNAWPDPELPVELSWQNETGDHSCTIHFPPAPVLPAEGGGFDITVLRDLPCTPKEEE
ncbi:MAG: hypothetical protein RLZZ427_930 [Pseudomonadota bacterium]